MYERPLLLPHLTESGFRDEVIETLAAACPPPINQTLPTNDSLGQLGQS